MHVFVNIQEILTVTGNCSKSLSRAWNWQAVGI